MTDRSKKKQETSDNAISDKLDKMGSRRRGCVISPSNPLRTEDVPSPRRSKRRQMTMDEYRESLPEWARPGAPNNGVIKVTSDKAVPVSVTLDGQPLCKCTARIREAEQKALGRAAKKRTILHAPRTSFPTCQTVNGVDISHDLKYLTFLFPDATIEVVEGACKHAPRKVTR